MQKRIVVSLFVAALLVITGGAFLWWQDQADVRALNKTLPQEVKVVKSLWGGEYKVVNKVDGYEFRVPKAWVGVEAIEYISNREEQGFNGTSISLIGKTGYSRTLSIDRFEIKNAGESLKEWAQSFFDTFGLEGTFDEIEINRFKVVKTIEEKHLGGSYIFFMSQNNKNYILTGGSEEFIEEIILSGKW